MAKIIMNHRHITIRKVADEVDIPIDSCHDIFANVFGMKHTSADFFPKLLNFEQKQRRMGVA